MQKIQTGMKFSSIEIRDLIKSLLAIGAAFAIAQVGLTLNINFIITLIISIITVGIGFLLHELAHKFFAQRYGCWSEFRSDDKMLLMALFFSLFGFVFAAPGAVLIQGRLTKKENGIISAAGPTMNLIVALGFALLLFVPVVIVKEIGSIGFIINSWLALFNMIPVGPFDGKKVLNWNKFAYGAIVVIALLFMFVSYL